MTENERIAKQMLAITRAAQQSPNPKYREAAERWAKRVQKHLDRDRGTGGALAKAA